VNGLLVPVGDIQALAAAIKRLAENKCLRERMGLANYQKSIKFSSDRVASQILEIIKSQ
jgi:glycosyltransferase involved in cell wall biosynthesis